MTFLKKIVVENLPYETKYIFKSFDNVNKPAGNRYIKQIIDYIYDDKGVILDKYVNSDINKIILLLNPVMIFELKQDNMSKNDISTLFDLNNVFENIGLEIGGNCVEKICSNDIVIRNKIYGLEPIVIGTIIYYPLPFNLMSGSLGKGIIQSRSIWYDKNITFEFTKCKFLDMIEKITLITECVIPKFAPDYSKMTRDDRINFAYNYNTYKDLIYVNGFDLKHKFTNISIDLDKKDYMWKRIKDNKMIESPIDEQILCKFNQIMRDEFILEKNNFNELCLRKRLYASHSIDKFYVYVQSTNSNTGIKKILELDSKLFSKLRFVVEIKNEEGENKKNTICEYDYHTLIYNNSQNVLTHGGIKNVIEIEYNVPVIYNNLTNYEYVYIEFDNFNIESSVESSVESSIELIVSSESVNYLNYMLGCCETCFRN